MLVLNPIAEIAGCLPCRVDDAACNGLAIDPMTCLIRAAIIGGAETSGFARYRMPDFSDALRPRCRSRQAMKSRC
jgi:hypothetical protein